MNYLQRWRQTTVANQAMVIATGLMAVGTLGLAVAAGFQYLTAREQSKAAREIVAQNEKLIQIASDQATAAKSSAEAAKTQADASTIQANVSEQMVKQNEKAVKASETQANASEKQADTSKASARAAEQSAEIAGRSLTIGERAYIGIETAKFIQPLAVGRKPSLRIIYVNGGRTPAWDFASRIRLISANQPLSEVRDRFPLAAFQASESGAGLITAGGKRVIDYLNEKDVLMTAARVPLIQNGSMKLYVVGEARYKDFTGKEQLLRFRLVYDPSDGGLNEVN